MCIKGFISTFKKLERNMFACGGGVERERETHLQFQAKRHYCLRKKYRIHFIFEKGVNIFILLKKDKKSLTLYSPKGP